MLYTHCDIAAARCSVFFPLDAMKRRSLEFFLNNFFPIIIFLSLLREKFRKKSKKIFSLSFSRIFFCCALDCCVERSAHTGEANRGDFFFALFLSHLCSGKNPHNFTAFRFESFFPAAAFSYQFFRSFWKIF